MSSSEGSRTGTVVVTRASRQQATPQATEEVSDPYTKLLYDLLSHVYGAGQMKGHTDYLTLAKASTWQTLYNDSVYVARPIFAGVVQNLSSSDPLTLAFAPTPGSFAPPTTAAGQGVVLNPAPVSGQGGGSKPFINIDLETVYVIGATKGDAFVVDWIF